MLSHRSRLLPACRDWPEDTLQDTIGPVSMQMATQMTTTLNRGPWTPDQQSAMAVAINAWSTAKEPKDSGIGWRKRQHCPHFEAYIDDNEFSFIDARSKGYHCLRSARIEIVTNKASLCGITCASERTSGRMVALIHWGEGVAPSSDDLKDTLYKVKKEIKYNQIRSPYPYQHLLKYPADPNELPELMKTHAFSIPSSL